MKYFYKPLKPFAINQRFGENNSCVSLDGLNHVISCIGQNPPKGYKSLYGPKGHLGLDLAASHGQEIYCLQKGVVNQIDTNPKSGLDVRIISSIDGRKFKHIYEHLLGYQAKVGDLIETGQLVGWADNTGYSSGDHLHLQVEELIDGVWVPIDPLSLMADGFAKDVLWINNKLKYIKEQLAFLLDNYANKLRK